MTVAPEVRRPQAFEADDPSLVVETPQPDAAQTEDLAPPAADQPPARPTLAQIGETGIRWGLLLASALFGAACLGVAAWFARIVSAALARDDWIGTATVVLLCVAAFAALMLVLRELVGMLRLARLSRLRSDVTRAVTNQDKKSERSAARRLLALYAARHDLAWARRRFEEHAGDVHDPGELLALADRELMAPLDIDARRLVTRSAKRVSTVTALSPLVFIAVGFVLIENLRLLRALATLYGGRPGLLGALALARMVFTHIIATGGIAMTDDLLGQFLGQDLLRRLSRRLGEGAFNGALTARVGVAAIGVIRPLPFLAARPPRLRDVLGEVLRPVFTGSKPAAKG
ncbi:MAG TPA: TIGR01620 family protein [Hyphomicrobiaceae bacterium]|nr:TIGR01620 family protein [Hyphomicrobiaceae bacterium]